jgi:hypothetical protein
MFREATETEHDGQQLHESVQSGLARDDRRWIRMRTRPQPVAQASRWSYGDHRRASQILTAPSALAEAKR